MALQYLVVLDFEATCDDGPMTHHPQKIIEFPAVVLCAKTGKTIHPEFHEYVDPAQPITEFCTDLTGITQEQVDAGAPIKEVMVRHVEWLYAHGLDPYDPKAHPRFAYVTCGDWDLKTCVVNDSVSPPTCMRRWINIKRPFRDLTGKKGGGMKGMLTGLGLPLVGRHHSGIDDTRNIAAITATLIQRGWKPHERDLTRLE